MEPEEYGLPSGSFTVGTLGDVDTKFRRKAFKGLPGWRFRDAGGFAWVIPSQSTRTPLATIGECSPDDRSCLPAVASRLTASLKADLPADQTFYTTDAQRLLSQPAPSHWWELANRLQMAVSFAGPNSLQASLERVCEVFFESYPQAPSSSSS